MHASNSAHSEHERVGYRASYRRTCMHYTKLIGVGGSPSAFWPIRDGVYQSTEHDDDATESELQVQSNGGELCRTKSIGGFGRDVV